MTIEMRKIEDAWVRPEAVESIRPYEGCPDRSVVSLASGEVFTVSLASDAVVAILAAPAETIRSWGDHQPVRYEGTVPRD